jgi:hypothetical protein
MCDSWSVATRLHKCRIKRDHKSQVSRINCHGNPDTWHIWRNRKGHRPHTHHIWCQKLHLSRNYINYLSQIPGRVTSSCQKYRNTLQYYYGFFLEKLRDRTRISVTIAAETTEIQVRDIVNTDGDYHRLSRLAVSQSFEDCCLRMWTESIFCFPRLSCTLCNE